MSRTRSLPPALAGHVAVLTLVIVVMAGAACTQRPASTAPTPGWKAPRGGELRVGVFEQPAVLDPQLGNLSVLGGELGRCCLGRMLLSYGAPPADEAGTTPRPDLAASLPQVSEDGLTWTFRLRRGLRYAPPLQEVEIVAQDFVRSFERFLSPDLRNGYAGYSRLIVAAGPIQGAQAYLDGDAPTITGIEAPDPHTLRFRLTRPSGDLSYLLAMPFAIPIPANPSDPEAPFGVAQGHPSDYGSFLVASGPYMLAGSAALDFSLPPVRQIPAAGVGVDAVTLVRNPSWADDPLRPAYVDRIVIQRVVRAGAPPEVAEQAADRGVQDGTVDLVLDWTPTSDELAAAARQDRPVMWGSQDILRFIGLNVAMPPLDDVHVRRAINLAIDAAPLVKMLAQSQPAAAASHIGLDGQEDNLLVNYAPYPFDPAKARAEMRRSGYDRDGDGRCDPALCPMLAAIGRAQSSYDPRPYDRFARAVAADLRTIGIRLHVRLLDDDAYITTYTNPKLHTAFFLNEGFGKDYPSAATLFPQFMGRGNHGETFTGCCNDPLVSASPEELRRWGYGVDRVPSVDDRINVCLRATFDDATRCWAELDQYLMEEVVPWVPVERELTGRIISDRISRAVFDQAVIPVPALDRIALTADAAAEPLPPLPSPHAPVTEPASAIPNGTYGVKISPADMAAVTEDPDERGYLASQNAGSWTLVLDHGHWSIRLDAPGELDTVQFTGVYTGSGDTVTLRDSVRPLQGPDLTTLRWRAGPDGLSFEPVEASYPVRYAALPWAIRPWTSQKA